MISSIAGKRARLALATLCIGLGLSTQAKADATLSGEKWVDTIKFSGDMRVRHEGFYYKQAGTAANTQDRNRERFRLRWGATAAIQDWTVGLRLASGTGEQVSTNQTEGAMFNQKQIWIDQAYISWKAHEYVKLTGGRMPNPIWRTYASDIVWDDDVNPEGYAESFDMPAGDRLGLFATFGQFPIFEARATPDPWMFANQLGARIRVTEDTRMTVAGSYYGFVNEKSAAFGAGSQQQGNSRVGATQQLATSLQLLHFTGEVATHLAALPVSLQGDFVHNAQDTQKAGSNGYQTGAIFGKAKDQNTWEVAYFWKYAQFNSSFADLADSDFGNGGLNRKGHILWIAYAPRDYVQLKAKYSITDTINPYIQSTGFSGSTFNGNSNNGNINRFQLDCVVKF